MKIKNLRTENQYKPLGIESEHPAFSWNVETKKKNWRQKAYQIVVECDEKIVWDSKKVESNQMVQIFYQGEALESDRRYRWSVIVWDEEGQVGREESYFETGLLKCEDWKGYFIGETQDFQYHLYRKGFVLKEGIQRARLYVCGLGHHVCEINKQSVSNRVLEPGWTDYRKTNFYSVYDVTKLVKSGKNAIGVKLGDGMYNVPGGRYVYYERSYGKMKLNVQLNITYEDGSKECVTTDGSWKMATSPIKFCCIYGGEDYDARYEQVGLSDPNYMENEDWKAVVSVEPPTGKIIASTIPPVKVQKKYLPVCVQENQDGSRLYDFGTNFSGWVRIKLKKNGAKEGSFITLIPGEILDEEGRPDQKVTGKGYHWRYYLGEKEEQEFCPDFTYTGFRYVLLESTDDEIEIKSIVGEFLYLDVEEQGSFDCSNSLLNQIHGIVKQAMRSNMKSYLTDCPHREKLPWLEQTHLIAPGLLYNFDLQNLYEKIEMDMKDSQRDNGLVPDICPEYVTFGYHEGFVDSPEWGSACIINPWYVYQRYGSVKLLKEYYPVMKKYLEYLTSRTHHHVLHHGLGDWLDIGPNTPWSQNTPVPVVATSIYYYDICIMKKVAALLGKKKDEQELEKLQRAVFEEYNLQFLDKETARYATGSQAAQALSLTVGLVPEEMRQKVTEMLRQDIIHRDYAVTAGDVGHPFLITAAVQNNLSEFIEKMTLDTKRPGYGYQVVNGATTLTEEWDGPEPNRPHGSQNHFMLGGIEEWFFAGLGGIRILHEDLVFGEVKISPYIESELESCEVSVIHPYGKILVSWKKNKGETLLKIEIPANLTAHIELEKYQIKETVGSGIWEYHILNVNGS